MFDEFQFNNLINFIIIKKHFLFPRGDTLYSCTECNLNIQWNTSYDNIYLKEDQLSIGVEIYSTMFSVCLATYSVMTQ